MNILTKAFAYIAVVGLVTLTACANNENEDAVNEDATVEEASVVAPVDDLAPPEGFMANNPQDDESVQMLASGQSFDEKGNVVDQDGSVVMPAAEAKKNNLKEQPHEKATKEDLQLVEKIINRNSKFIATARLGNDMATNNEFMDMAGQLEGERMMFNDMARNFLDITHSKANVDENPDPEKITAAKGAEWDKAWANKLLEMNKDLVVLFRNSKPTHHEIKNIMQQITEHIHNENQLLKEVLNRPQE